MRSHTSTLLIIALAALAAALPGCLSSTGGANQGPAQAAGDDAGTDPASDPDDQDAIQYRDLASHPGCTTDGLTYTPAKIAGYPCAAKEYPLSGAEDTSKPIILLVHGNSSSPRDWETCNKGGGTDPVTSGCTDTTTPMLSERLVAAGYHVFAVDMRPDKSDDPTTNDEHTGNPAKNIDHGWGVPIVQSFIGAMMNDYPSRQLSIVAFSLGPTVVRDALRRLHRAGAHPFEHIDTLVFASGAEHGVSTFSQPGYCVDPAHPDNTTMKGRVTCEMGNRQAFTPTAFDKGLNGPNTNTANDGRFLGAFETPCLDGDTAFGQHGVCGGHKVRYTTVVMQDVSQGTYQDEFTCQACSMLNGADNETVALSDVDPTGYFYNGAFKHHFGSIRSEHGLQIIMAALTHSNG
jgi:pimeloyl-ACP methyl ester carboxylesterase